MDGLRFTILNETPCAEPHAGCCGGWRLDTSGYPIIRHANLILYTFRTNNIGVWNKPKAFFTVCKVNQYYAK